jgi:putative endonuclease
MYTVYVLYSVKHDKIYIGYTSDMTNRLLSHNQLGTKGWTIQFRPWVVIHEEHLEEKSAAVKKRKTIEDCSGKKIYSRAGSC